LKIPSSIDVSAAALPARYIGLSLGSILGGGFIAFAGYERAVFLVAGSPLSFLLTRADLFALYTIFLDIQFYNR
jgi:hypothetical protein